MYGNPAAMSLERERLGIPPGGHHVGLDPNDPMVCRPDTRPDRILLNVSIIIAIALSFSLPRVLQFPYQMAAAHSSASAAAAASTSAAAAAAAAAAASSSQQQPPPDVAGFQLPREFVFGSYADGFATSTVSVEWSVVDGLYTHTNTHTFCSRL